MHRLEVEHISKSFDGKRVIEDVSFTLEEGEIISLLGVSGGGKTTLFNIIAGLTVPDEGDVRMDGTSLIGCPGRISYMLQKDLLLGHKTVLDNIALPLVLGGMKKKEARQIAAAHLKQFGLSGHEKKYPHELSGGMRQRAALLRTYLFSAGQGSDRAGVVLLDEPFSALDAITRAAMHIWYLSVMEELKLPTVFITHDVDEAILLSDRILILGRQAANDREESQSDSFRIRAQCSSSCRQAADDGEESQSDSFRIRAQRSSSCRQAANDRPTTITQVVSITGRETKTREYMLSQEFLSYKKMILETNFF